GSLYLHIDWRVGHEVKLMLDELFGRRAFRNMIIWHYGGRGAKAIAGQFPRNYDMLLAYSKTPQATFNRLRQVDRVPVGGASRRGYRRDADGRWFKTAPRGDYTDDSIRRLEREGRVHRTRTGKVRIKYYLPQEDGHVLDDKPLGDVWGDIPDMMHAPAVERTGFPTQKPEALLARIIEASSNPGGLVADFFCGSGTTAVVAERLRRRWIACDASLPAIDIARRRLMALPARHPFDLLAVEDDQGPMPDPAPSAEAGRRE
ncbi:MAG: site-specific DNA-methyltransferase, partial [Dehalococcoidia bacterium]